MIGNTRRSGRRSKSNSIRFLRREKVRLWLEPLEERTLLSGNYGQLPLSFTPNVGQADGRVQFLSEGSGYSLFLTSDEAVLDLRRGATPGASAADVVAVSLVGASPQARAVGQDQLPGTANYLMGSDPSQWHTGIPTYATVDYQNVYPGVDLVYYGNQQQLEYDFVLHPGASPGAIRLRISGAVSLSLDAQRNLVLHTSGGDVVEKAPQVYQVIAGVRHSVASRFVVQDSGIVGFAVSAYDASQPLTIDPVLSYSTYLGGSDGDSGLAVAVDRSGSAYLTGSTLSRNFPTVITGVQTNSSGSGMVFVSKLNAAGTALVYSTYLGGTMGNSGNAIAVDAQGDAYIAGSTTSTDFPTAGTPFQSTAQGGDDAFVAKLNPTGSQLIYSTYLGGTNNDEGNAIAVDATGAAYVTGDTVSSDFPTAGNPPQPSHASNTDAFVAKLNPSGSALIYSTYLGGTGLDQAHGIAIDGSGNAYVVGFTLSTDFPTVAALQPHSGGGSEQAFITKLNAAGSAFVYSSYLGGSKPDGAYGVAVDATGAAYLAGFAESTNFPTAGSPFQAHLNPANSTISNVFVSELNPAGSALVYSTYLGGSYLDQATGIALDGSGDAWITGQTGSSDFPTSQPIQGTFRGKQDAFVAELNAAGSQLLFSSYFGGASGTSQGNGIATDSAGNAYVVGMTSSQDFPTASSIQAGNAGLNDAFVLKLSSFTWRPTDVSVGSDGNARLLWDAPQNTTALWSVSGSTVTAGTPAGPFAGWIGKAVASGADGLTRILWQQTSHAAELWLVAADGTVQKAALLGPFDGWIPKDVAVGSDGQTRLLWTNSNGAAVVWSLDSNLNLTSNSNVFGPFAGWTAQSIAAGGDGLLRLLWTNVNGSTALWLLNANGSVNSIAVFGANAGWTAIDVTVGTDNLTRILWSNVNGAAAVWSLNSQLQVPVAVVYGASAGWTAEALDAAPDGTLRLLWYDLNGQAALWTLSSADVLQSAAVFGPV